MTEKAFNQEYLAEFVVRENLVLNEFDRKRHIKERPNNILIKKQIAGVDFGFAHPTAIIYLSICYDGNIYADTEYVAKGITNTDVIRILKDSDPDEIWPDIAEPQRIQEMRQSNLKVFDNYKKDVEKQFDNINTLLKQDKLFISKRCLCLIDEIESYSYLEDKSGRPLETLPKEGDDCLAALRYALSNYNPINIEYRMKNDIN
ncbi:MAG: terminase large subunit, partial [Candidatus Pacebacteria bacterium]|nr:terminase large subunit [Candidatus Paceibacterota bacterium]